MTRKHALLFTVLGLLCIYLFVLQIAAIWPFTIDDMYISLRYAKNWENGAGLLWNIDEQPVEGYSNFLFVCLAALALKIGLNPVIMLKIMGVAGLVLTSGALYCLSRFWFSQALALIPILWLLFYRDEIVWVSSGLETTTYQALLLLSVYTMLRGLGFKAVPQQSRGDLLLGYWLAAGVLLALAGLTRPEGGVVGVIFFVIAYFNLPKTIELPSCLQERQQHWLCFALGSGVFALIYGAYFLWRWHYYGLLMPNSVYCKGFAKSHWLVLDKSYLQLAWPFLLLSTLGVFSQKNQSTGHDRRLYFLWIPSLIYLLFLAQADPVSAIAQRLFLPAFVLLLPLSLLGIGQIIDYFTRKEQTSSHVLFIAAGSLWVGVLCLPIASLQELASYTQNPQAGEQLRVKVADWLKQYISPNDHIVLADSGILAYLLPSRFEDSYCLNNKKMGEDSYANMFDRVCERTLRQKPAVIIVASVVAGDKIIYSAADSCLNKKLASNLDYQKARLFQTNLTNNSRYRYEIYVRAVPSKNPCGDWISDEDAPAICAHIHARKSLQFSPHTDFLMGQQWIYVKE